mmetsp:Transcript_30478/g.25736  ORF Transcript_30478/g.25736 Transcript_30478/m.25736 type:complete len:214 (+) Transcript_30478:220-861(+)
MKESHLSKRKPRPQIDPNKNNIIINDTFNNNNFDQNIIVPNNISNKVIITNKVAQSENSPINEEITWSDKPFDKQMEASFPKDINGNVNQSKDNIGENVMNAWNNNELNDSTNTLTNFGSFGVVSAKREANKEDAAGWLSNLNNTNIQIINNNDNQIVKDVNKNNNSVKSKQLVDTSNNSIDLSSRDEYTVLDKMMRETNKQKHMNKKKNEKL